MGLLSDFFIAPRHEVASRNLAEGPRGRFPTVEGGGLDPVDLTGLEERLTGTAAWQIKQNVVAEGDGWWVIELSEALAAAIALVNPETSEAYADRWQLSADEADLVEALGDLAREAVDGQKTMFAWLSL